MKVWPAPHAGNYTVKNNPRVLEKIEALRWHREEVRAREEDRIAELHAEVRRHCSTTPKIKTFPWLGWILLGAALGLAVLSIGGIR